MKKFLLIAISVFAYQSFGANDEFADMHTSEFQIEGDSCNVNEFVTPELKAGQFLKIPVKTNLEKSPLDNKVNGVCNFSLIISAQEHSRIVFDMAQAKGHSSLPAKTEMETQIRLIAQNITREKDKDSGKNTDGDDDYYERTNPLWTSLRTNDIVNQSFYMASSITFETTCGGELELKGQIASSLEDSDITNFNDTTKNDTTKNDATKNNTTKNGSGSELDQANPSAEASQTDIAQQNQQYLDANTRLDQLKLHYKIESCDEFSPKQ